MNYLGTALFGLALVGPAFGQTVIDPDFGLAFEPPPGFAGSLVEGPVDDADVLIAVRELAPTLTPADGAQSLCEITFSYDPTYGMGDQQWLNALLEQSDFYRHMGESVVIPGTMADSTDFTHNGSAAHNYWGRLDQGGFFLVSIIPSPEGFAIVTCALEEADQDPAWFQPIIDGIVLPGQPRDTLAPVGACAADAPDIPARPEDAGAVDKEAALVKALDAERKRIAQTCDVRHADAMLDEAMDALGFAGSYRDFRVHQLSQAGFHLLTPEESAALETAHQQMLDQSDAETADRFVQYLLFTSARDTLLGT